MTKIVIAGAGFGGVRAALDLAGILPDAQIILINNNPFHTYIADLYEVASSRLESSSKLSFDQLEGTVNILLSQIFKSHKNVRLLIDVVNFVDPDKSLVVTGKEKLSYDYLVLALGATTNFFNIPGARDYSHPLKTIEDALNIRNDLVEEVSGDKKLKIVIAGGGFTGVETAGKLKVFLKDKCHIIILEGSETILPGMARRSQKIATGKLKDLGIEVKTNHLIKKVTQTQVFCSDQNIDYDYLIWTTGIKGENLEGKIKQIKFTDKNQIALNPDLSVPGFENIFVVGDLAKTAAPATAWVAIAEAKLVAKNIYSGINNRELKNFSSPPPAFIVPIGLKFAVAEVYSLKMTGILAWILKELVGLRYFLSILPPDQALKIWFQGVKIFTH